MNTILEHYLKLWELTTPEWLAKTFTSNIYKAQASNETIVLKILSGKGAEDESSAADVLTWFDGQGAIRLLQHDAGAMLLEYVKGDDLTELVRTGKDDEATQIIAGVLNQLHSAKDAQLPRGLTPLPRRFQSLFAAASLGSAPPILGRGAVTTRSLFSDENQSFVLHGDIHHENIRHHQERGWLAIDPKGLWGDRIYDAANALCNPLSMPEIAQSRDRLLRQAGIMADALEVNCDRLLSYAFAHACLSASWCIEDGHDPGHFLAMAEIAERSIKPQPV